MARSTRTRGGSGARTKPAPSIWPWALGIGSLVLIVVAVVVGTQPGSTESSSAPPNSSKQGSQQGESNEPRFDVERRLEGDVTALGDVDAPVVMVEYSDYRCPFCAVVARDTIPAIIEEYVESGQLRIEWRDFPIFGEQSMDAAVAGRAAGEQGLFWEYNEAIYAEAPARSHIELPRERLIAFAEQIGVPDIEKFTADLDNPELIDAVKADSAEAKAIGVSSTPIFIIGNTPVVGAQSYEAFADVIDAELAAVGE